jgi:hypothetical protein
MSNIVFRAFDDIPAGHWNQELAKGLTVRGNICEHCKQVQMRPAIYVELRTLVQNGQMTREEMAVACEGFCLGHANEWIPDFIIHEERQP